MAAMAGGGWGAHGSDDFKMYRVFKFTRLPISLPGKEMDLAEADRRRPSAGSSFLRQCFFRSRAHPLRVGIGRNGMARRGALMSQASFRLALTTSLSWPPCKCETALAVTLASLFDNRPLQTAVVPLPSGKN